MRHSSESLLRLIRQVLTDSGHSIHELDGVVVLRGPGSFTGLRIGLATALGLHQATGVPAVAIGTLEVLAEVVETDSVVAVVDALRGEWIAQTFARQGAAMRAQNDPRRVASKEVADLDSESVIGFACSTISGADPESPIVRYQEPEELASTALRRVTLAPPEWDAGTLIEPIYFRPAAATKMAS